MRGMAILAAGAVLASAAPALAQPVPNPILYLTGTETYAVGGKEWVRHRFGVFNNAEYPGEMFEAAPTLPPCGVNANSSRSWVDFFDGGGKRLYGFCALGSPANLDKIWFATPAGEVPPSWVYIEIHDRLTGRKYKSNLAETTP